MRVAVITPFYRPRVDWLRQCHESVLAQTHPCTHFLVADGGAENPLTDFNGQLIQLHHRHDDFGDTPRSVGGLSAAAQGFDAIAYLDDDNWFYPHHIESLVALHRQTTRAICTSTRDIFHIDGRKLGRCVEIDGQHFVDTNCFLLTRDAFSLLGVWALMPPRYHQIGDIYFCATLRKSPFKTAHSGLATVAYRATRSHTYDMYGEIIPAGVKDSVALARQLQLDGITVGYLPNSRAPILPL